MDIRNEICLKLALFGVEAEVHHHEVGTAGQCEIGSRGDNAIKRGGQQSNIEICGTQCGASIRQNGDLYAQTIGR